MASKSLEMFSASADGDAGESLLGESQRMQATADLLDAHHDTVYRYQYRLSSCHAAAEDLTQEVFLRAFKSLHQLKEPAAARGWLLAIARNEFLRWCKRQRPTSSIDEAAVGSQVADDQQEVGVGLEQQEWVRCGMESLSPEYRIVVAMYYFEELSYSEIASQLNVPIGTVMSRLSRAKKNLREQLVQAKG